MNFRYKIILGLSTVLLLTLSLSIVSIYYLQAIGRASEKVLQENYRIIKSSETMILSLSKTDQLLARITHESRYDDSLITKLIYREIVNFEKQLSLIKGWTETEQEKEIISRIDREFDTYQKQIFDFRQTNDRLELYFWVMQRKNEQLRNLCHALSEINHDKINSKDKETKALFFTARNKVFVLFGLVMFMVAFSLIFIPDNIVKPLFDLTQKIRRISRREYDQRIEVPEKSELKDLAEAFNTMADELSKFDRLNMAEIKAKNDLIEKIIKNLQDPLLILDNEDRIFLANERALELLELNTADKVEGIHLSDIKGEAAKLLYDDIKNNEDKVAEHSKHQLFKNFIKIKKSQGQVFYFTKELALIFKQEDEKAAAMKIIVLKDITKYKNRDEEKTGFIAAVSHELKTPLSALNMSILLLQNDRVGILNEEQKETVNNMKAETQRLIRMVSDLLDLSKSESGKAKIQITTEDPVKVLEMAIKTVSEFLKEKSITLNKAVTADSLAPIQADGQKISWVLINFLNNAIRYTAVGGNITIGVEQNSVFTEMYVKDYGPGVAPEYHDEIFQKFTQIQNEGTPQHKGGSLGIGLAISKEIIDEHAGQIGVESDVGKGAKFFIRLFN
ncbi:MAG: HAMP domain-containing protein [Cyclobacteriaceae bacterium]|nr:HAMP domain-containing protein [Cyclobacteriaceae bacterium]MCH8517615.1 HAMP domain-containing protein [Cyclobacteriaceae bacterium]